MLRRSLNLIPDALIVAVVLTYAAVVVDLGLFLKDRGHDRNVAEAMAMAGAEELPLNPIGATVKAHDWAVRYGIATSEIETIEVQTREYPNDTMHVKLKDTFSSIAGWAFAKVTSKARAEGAAQAGSLAYGHTMPWGLLPSNTTCLDGNGKALYDATCILKVGASDGISGWYGALDYDGKGGGGAEYRANIIDGTTDWHYCIAADAAAHCASAATTVYPLHGNQVGSTAAGVDTRLSVVKCDANANGRDDFAEVFLTQPGATPNYEVVCPYSPRLIVVPIVSYDSTPVHKVTIRGWALGYLSDHSCLSESDDDDDDEDKRKKRNRDDSGWLTSKHDDDDEGKREKDRDHDGDDDEGKRDKDRDHDGGDDDDNDGDRDDDDGNDDDDGDDDEPTPTPSSTPVATPSPSPNTQGVHAYISVYASPSPPPTPTRGPTDPCKRGKGHWVVNARIVDSTYSEASGFLAAQDATSGVAVPRRVRN